MTAVPFRIKVTLIVLGVFALLILVGPLLVPVPALGGTVEPSELAYPDSVFVDLSVPGGAGLRVHVQSEPSSLTPADAHAARAGGAASADAGTGFVLLHGFGSQTLTWRHLMPALAGAGPVLAFDRPAFGLTERPMPGDWPRGANPYTAASQVGLTIALMDAYGMDRAVLVGHSAGGSLALEVALAHPERVVGLVLVSPAVVRGGGAPAWSRPLLQTPQMSRVGPLAMRQLGGQPGEDFLRAAYADPSRLDPVDVAAYRLALRVNDWDRALWELTKASREPQLLGHLGRVDVPVLVLSGAEDTIVPFEQSEQVAARLPRATLALVPDCGHVAHEECPGPTIDAVTTWLAAQLPDF
jgi:pimeloyl-ACP methyl ester carboxylesterase